jgi:hypothetical protein
MKTATASTARPKQVPATHYSIIQESDFSKLYMNFKVNSSRYLVANKGALAEDFTNEKPTSDFNSN